LTTLYLAAEKVRHSCPGRRETVVRKPVPEEPENGEWKSIKVVEKKNIQF